MIHVFWRLQTTSRWTTHKQPIKTRQKIECSELWGRTKFAFLLYKKQYFSIYKLEENMPM